MDRDGEWLLLLVMFGEVPCNPVFLQMPPVAAGSHVGLGPVSPWPCVFVLICISAEGHLGPGVL